MIDFDYIKLIIGTAIVIIGWVAGHLLTTSRDIKIKRRDTTIKHLITAYRILTNDISHRSPSKKRSRKLESILADIQLFGSPRQIKLAKDLADIVAQDESFELDPLINDLRSDLRKELKLKRVEGNVKWLRFNK